jgi:hypothetical protein
LLNEEIKWDLNQEGGRINLATGMKEDGLPNNCCAFCKKNFILSPLKPEKLFPAREKRTNAKLAMAEKKPGISPI